MNMKNMILTMLIFSNIALYSQGNHVGNRPSGFHISILGGLNYTNSSGPSVKIEGSTEMIRHLNLKFSIGYTVAYNDNFQRVKAYRYVAASVFPDKYETDDYNIYDTKFNIVPISLGIEYVFDYGKFSPYAFVNGSYNVYDAKFGTSPIVTGADGYYNSYDKIPAAYQNQIPAVPGVGSFGLGFGIGSRIYLSDIFDLDVRYIYQFNSTIVNMHQLLVGFML